MRTDRAMLFVIDGSKALSKAIRAKFGARAVIQRCQVHKKRNVEDHLPDEMKRNADRTISAACQSGNAARAKRMLEALARQLERKHPSAAASLREGLDETLTVMRMNLEASLARTLSTTNPIEFVNGRIRRTTRNVAKWDGTRWSCAGSPSPGSRPRRRSGSCVATRECRSSSPRCALTMRSSSRRSLTRRGRSRGYPFTVTEIQQDSGRSPVVNESSACLFWS